MSGKPRGLRIRAAYLRLAGREGGLGLNIKWAPKLTGVLKSMMKTGDVVLRREGYGGRKNVTVAYLTDQGRTRLAELNAKYGPDFGCRADIDSLDTRRVPPPIITTLRRKAR